MYFDSRQFFIIGRFTEPGQDAQDPHEQGVASLLLGF